MIYNVPYFAGKLPMKRTTVWKTAACESNTFRRKKGVMHMCIESCTQTSTDFCIVKWRQVYPILSRTSLPFRHCVIKDEEMTEVQGFTRQPIILYIYLYIIYTLYIVYILYIYIYYRLYIFYIIYIIYYIYIIYIWYILYIYMIYIL